MQQEEHLLQQRALESRSQSALLEAAAQIDSAERSARDWQDTCAELQEQLEGQRLPQGAVAQVLALVALIQQPCAQPMSAPLQRQQELRRQSLGCVWQLPNWMQQARKHSRRPLR